MCFGMRGIVLCKSGDVKRVQDPGSVSPMGGNENGGVGGKEGYIYWSSCDFLVQLGVLVNEYKTARPSACTTTRHLMNETP